MNLRSISVTGAAAAIAALIAGSARRKRTKPCEFAAPS
jgi:hypothetical protein